MELWSALLTQGIVILIPAAVLLIVSAVMHASPYSDSPKWTVRGVRAGAAGVIAALVVMSLSIWAAVR